MPASCLFGPITVASRYPLRILLVLGVLMALHDWRGTPRDRHHLPNPRVPSEPTVHRHIVPNATRHAPSPLTFPTAYVATPCNCSRPAPRPATKVCTAARPHHSDKAIYMAGLGAWAVTMAALCVWFRKRARDALARNDDVQASLQQVIQRLIAESVLAASKLTESEAARTEEQRAARGLRQESDALRCDVLEKTVALRRNSAQLDVLQATVGVLSTSHHEAATENMVRAVCIAAKHATSADAVDWLFRALSAAALGTRNTGSTNTRRNSLATEEVTAAICFAAKHATTPAAVESLFRAVAAVASDSGNVSDANARKNKLATEEMTAAVCIAAKHATTADAVEWLFGAVNNVAVLSGNDSDANARKNKLATEAMTAAVCVAAKYATTSDAVHWLFRAVAVVAGDNGNVSDANARKNKLATEEMTAAVSIAAKYATTSGAVHWLFRAVAAVAGDSGNVSDANARKNKLATEEMAAAVCIAAKHATSADAVEWLFGAVDVLAALSVGSSGDSSVFQRQDVRDALCHLSSSSPCCDRVKELLFSRTAL